MVSKQHFVLVEPLNDGKESLKVFCVVQIRHCLPDFVVHLRQRGTAHAILAATQINGDQVGWAVIQAQLWRQGGANVLHGSKARDDQ